MIAPLRSPPNQPEIEFVDPIAGEYIGFMAFNVAEILALPRREREKLLEALMETTVPADIPPLVREFVARTERTTRALESALERLDRLDETIERNRTEVREAVRQSGDVWPFPLPPS